MEKLKIGKITGEYLYSMHIKMGYDDCSYSYYINQINFDDLCDDLKLKWNNLAKFINNIKCPNCNSGRYFGYNHL